MQVAYMSHNARIRLLLSELAPGSDGAMDDLAREDGDDEDDEDEDDDEDTDGGSEASASDTEGKGGGAGAGSPTRRGRGLRSVPGGMRSPGRRADFGSSEAGDGGLAAARSVPPLLYVRPAVGRFGLLDYGLQRQIAMRGEAAAATALFHHEERLTRRLGLTQHAEHGQA